MTPQLHRLACPLCGPKGVRCDCPAAQRSESRRTPAAEGASPSRPPGWARAEPRHTPLAHSCRGRVECATAVHNRPLLLRPRWARSHCASPLPCRSRPLLLLSTAVHGALDLSSSPPGRSPAASRGAAPLSSTRPGRAPRPSLVAASWATQRRDCSDSNSAGIARPPGPGPTYRRGAGRLARPAVTGELKKRSRKKLGLL